MDNNQFNNQQPVQQPIQQPMQQPVQPMYNQPVQPMYNQKKTDSKVGLILALVIGIPIVLAIIVAVFVPLFRSASGANDNTMNGNWTCTGTNGTLTVNADTSNKKVVLKISSLTIDATYKRSGKVTPAKKKDGYVYTQYIFTGGSNSAGQTYSEAKKVGFVFGVDPNNKNVAHYVDGVSATSMDFSCTRD